MLIYMDLCCFNRPYDDQDYEPIKIETEAKLYIQEQIKQEDINLAWSYFLDYENYNNPNSAVAVNISAWKTLSKSFVTPDNSIKNKALELINNYSIDPKDSLHVACALKAKCEYFLTVDHKILKKLSNNTEIKVLNPINFISILEEINEE